MGAAAHVQSAGIEAHLEGFPETDEREATEPLTAFHALEQEAGLNGASLANAETGVSRSPAMSNGGFK